MNVNNVQLLLLLNLSIANLLDNQLAVDGDAVLEQILSQNMTEKSTRPFDCNVKGVLITNGTFDRD